MLRRTPVEDGNVVLTSLWRLPPFVEHLPWSSGHPASGQSSARLTSTEPWVHHSSLKTAHKVACPLNSLRADPWHPPHGCEEKDERLTEELQGTW